MPHTRFISHRYWSQHTPCTPDSTSFCPPSPRRHWQMRRRQPPSSSREMSTTSERTSSRYNFCFYIGKGFSAALAYIVWIMFYDKIRIIVFLQKMTIMSRLSISLSFTLLPKGICVTNDLFCHCILCRRNTTVIAVLWRFFVFGKTFL